MLTSFSQLRSGLWFFLLVDYFTSTSYFSLGESKGLALPIFYHSISIVYLVSSTVFLFNNDLQVTSTSFGIYRQEFFFYFFAWLISSFILKNMLGNIGSFQDYSRVSLSFFIFSSFFSFSRCSSILYFR